MDRNGWRNKGGEVGDRSTGDENDKANKGGGELYGGLDVPDFVGQIIDIARGLHC
jgi:hypothetical protein